MGIREDSVMDGTPTAEHSGEVESESNADKEQVLIGIGGNLGDPAATCREAVDTLRSHPDIRVLRTSALYRTEPVGKTDQGWFVNAMVLCSTALSPDRLLKELAEIENRFGRLRHERWGPRALDLDIVAFGELVIETVALTLPHPRLHERKFVLIPLLEILPEWKHPLYRQSAREMLEDLGDKEGQAVELLGTV
jgi:2-amino-4-hydroxy-6-hydroxymethyldihydropteridine diphosphokinase